MTRAPIVSASILGADFGNLGEALAELERAGCDEIHLDVMDGHYVDNISFGLPILETITRHCSIPVEAHMMVTNPRKFITPFQQAGCSIYTVHYEVCTDDAKELAGEIKSSGMEAGIALNPATAPSSVAMVMSAFSRVLVMSVVPGRAGQPFMPEVLPKLEYFCLVRSQYQLGHIKIAVDGGIKGETAELARKAGADLLVSATGIFGDPGGIRAGVAKLRRA